MTKQTRREFLDEQNKARYNKQADTIVNEGRYGIMRDSYIQAQQCFAQLITIRAGGIELDAAKDLLEQSYNFEYDEQQGFLMGWLASAWAYDNNKATQEGLTSWKDASST